MHQSLNFKNYNIFDKKKKTKLNSYQLRSRYPMLIGEGPKEVCHELYLGTYMYSINDSLKTNT